MKHNMVFRCSFEKKKRRKRRRGRKGAQQPRWFKTVHAFSLECTHPHHAWVLLYTENVNAHVY
jgi:hypothetical protein